MSPRTGDEIAMMVELCDAITLSFSSGGGDSSSDHAIVSPVPSDNDSDSNRDNNGSFVRRKHDMLLSSDDTFEQGSSSTHDVNNSSSSINNNNTTTKKKTTRKCRTTTTTTKRRSKKSGSSATTTTSSSSSCSSDNDDEKGVRFGVVKVHEFNMIKGDHPDVTSGCPVTIDWNGEETMVYDAVKHDRAKRRENRGRKQRRNRLDFKLTATDRSKMYVAFFYSLSLSLVRYIVDKLCAFGLVVSSKMICGQSWKWRRHIRF